MPLWTPLFTRVSTWSAVLLLLLAAVVGPALAQGPAPPGIGPTHLPGFVSGPGSGDPVDRVRDTVRANLAALGLERADLDDWIVTDVTTSQHNGVAHVYLRQRLAGVEVDGGNLHANVMPDGRVFGLSNRFVPQLQRSANTRAPALSAAAAVAAAADVLGLTLTEPVTVVSTTGGPARETLLSDGGISLDPIPVKLVYHTDGEGDARLAWNLFVRLRDQQHWWNVNIDAVTGALLRQTDWILNDSYRVVPPPLENPDAGARTIEVDPADVTASPFAWHDTNGASGGEFTDTRGNNVNAQEDADGNNSGGFRPSGTGLMSDVYDFPLDLHEAPATSQSAAITNLFHWNNVLHDIHYQYGFDEASGNFQVNNYGKGGVGGDPVNADALDGSGLNNANFSRAAEGFSPRMQMFRFEHTGLTIHAPTALRQMLRGGTAEFGAALTTTGITDDVVQALDPADAPLFSTTDGCSALTNGAQVSGKIALIDRGECTFVQKVSNAQAAGAVAVLIVNNDGDEVLLMGGTDPTVTISSMFIGQTHGEAIEAALGSGVNLTLSSLIQRDGDFDNGIIIHEYGHGVSVRLSGGPGNVGCLGLAQSRGMGEGWGDFWALAITASPSDQGADARPLGSYAQGEGPNGPGIRNFPYSTDLLVNPQTFVSIDGTNQPHGVGEIWAQALWEVYWNLVVAHGFDPDLYNGTGGNNLTLQLVMDALKLQDCDPTFLEARDAILMADATNNGGANQCLIWDAFAKRGMGFDADDTGNPRRLQVTEDFSLPPTCIPACGNGIVETGEQCDDANTVPGDCCSVICGFESAGSVCDADGSLCTDADVCDGAGACTAGALLACDDVNGCTDDSCNPASGCVFANNTAPCDADGSVCTSDDTCSGGVCVAGTPLTCDDVNGCTDDSCNPASGCVFANNTAPCDADGSVCTSDDTCSGGVCVAGTPLTCDDVNGCTDDSCNPASGCVFANNTAPCDADGSVCTSDDTCSGGVCVAGTPLTCDDVNGCTDDSCNPASGCVFANNTAPCDADGSVCTSDDTCSGGVCLAGTPLECDDGDPCTAESCDAMTGCALDPIPLCGTSIPVTPTWGRALLALLLLAAFGVALTQRGQLRV